MSSIGPRLPPHLIQKGDEDQVDDSNIGPQLPPHLKESENEDAALNSNNTHPSSTHSTEATTENKKSSYGPALPPGFDSGVKKVLGPSLPPNLTKGDAEEVDDETDDDDAIGPVLPQPFSDDDKVERLRKEFESRSKAMKEKLEGKSDAAQGNMERESWMTELPDAWTKNFGVGPRKFRTNRVDVGDQSIWTDTPADKERKRQEALERAKTKTSEKKRKVEPARQPTVEEVNLEEKVAAYNQMSRPQSLLEMHREKRKKTNDEGESAVRRPFDRDRDLSLHSRTNSKQKSQIIEHAKGLNSKFAKGSYESKFL